MCLASYYTLYKRVLWKGSPYKKSVPNRLFPYQLVVNLCHSKCMSFSSCAAPEPPSHLLISSINLITGMPGLNCLVTTRKVLHKWLDFSRFNSIFLNSIISQLIFIWFGREKYWISSSYFLFEKISCQISPIDSRYWFFNCTRFWWIW